MKIHNWENAGFFSQLAYKWDLKIIKEKKQIKVTARLELRKKISFCEENYDNF